MSESPRTPQPPAGGSIEDDVAFEPVIGLEIHVQLATATKMFCSCELSFGEPPNTRTCPVCLGLPGSLPVANARAIHLGLMIGLALGSELAPRSIFHRKNYFYPDLPKGYQISQSDEPLCRGGSLADVRIHRVHLEEDAAKLIHLGSSGRIHGSDASIVDFNRGGTPLAEIVTEPDVRSPEQASEWLKLLRTTLRQLGVSDVNMEEGSLRSKEEAHDYRYFPEPDLLPVAIDQRMLADARAAMSELPVARAERLAREHGLSADSAQLLAFRGELGDYFEAALAAGGASSLAGDGVPAPPAQALANWVTGELLSRLEDGERAGGDLFSSRVSPRALAQLVGLVDAKRVSVGAARQVLDKLVAEGGEPQAIVDAEGLAAMDGGGEELAAIVAAAIDANADAAQRVRDGNAKAIGPIVGAVMRETKGRADGTEVARLIHEQLGT